MAVRGQVRLGKVVMQKRYLNFDFSRRIELGHEWTLAWLALSRAAALRRETGLPTGRLIYADTDQNWRPNDDPLYSATHHLTGKPDYLVETPAGIMPVEVKSTETPNIPYLGQLLQLAAYCLLVEEKTGHAPPHGLLKYSDALYEVDFTPE